MSNPASFATAATVEGNNTFVGDQTITGALAVTGAQTHVGNVGITGNLTVTHPASTSGTPSQALTVANAADLAITASTESPSIMLSVGATRTWATGAITNQREIRIAAPSYAFAGASTITNAATVYITGAPAAGANATITNSYALWCGGAVRFDGALCVSATATTTADPTINKASGQVSVAIGASTCTVTNSLVSATSIVIATLQFVDATFTQILSVVPGSGSFVITGNATATALTKIGFVVINPA